jgi:methionyl-tRNA formyltransferase
MVVVDMALSIIFAGTSEFALPSLKALIKSSHPVTAVYTKPDRPAGRGQKLTASPVKQFAQQHNLPIYQAEILSETERADIMVNVAYGLLIPKGILTAFKYGCINVHPSLLPRWRGAAPIQRAILAGDTEIGVTIMQMDAGLDTGDILKQSKIPINTADTTATMYDKLAKLGAELLLDVLVDIEANKLKPIAQDNSKSCYANKITKQEAQINWQSSAIELDRAVRAFNPWPIAFTKLDSLIIRIWKAIVINNTIRDFPGTILNADKKGIDVATKSGILRLLELQLPGGKILSAMEILNSKRDMFKPGKCFHA